MPLQPISLIAVTRSDRGSVRIALTPQAALLQGVWCLHELGWPSSLPPPSIGRSHNASEGLRTKPEGKHDQGMSSVKATSNTASASFIG